MMIPHQDGSGWPIPISLEAKMVNKFQFGGFRRKMLKMLTVNSWETPAPCCAGGITR